MKIYIASSWKNELLVLKIKHMLETWGHELDAFCDSSSDRYVFHFSEIGPSDLLNAVNFLQDERVQRAFKEDKKWLDWCECCLLVLPAGNSAHLEGGYVKGTGKLLIIYRPVFPNGEFDVMYGFADLVTDDPTEIKTFLERFNVEQMPSHPREFCTCCDGYDGYDDECPIHGIDQY